MLKDHTHPVPADFDQFFSGFLQQVFAIKQDNTGLGLDQSRQATYNR